MVCENSSIEAVTPWTALVAEFEPFYPKGEGRGRPPIGLERMLRMYIAQQCFGLSDEATEEAIYDSLAFGDTGYQGAEKRPEHKATHTRWQVAMHYGKRKALPDTELGRLDEQIEQMTRHRGGILP
jgi:hypothetical protein